jgi:hypothetical protein
MRKNSGKCNGVCRYVGAKAYLSIVSGASNVASFESGVLKPSSSNHSVS